MAPHEEEGRRIVLAVDQSLVSQDAVSWAAKRLLRAGDSVDLVSVLEPGARPDFAAGGEAAYPLGESVECAPDPAQLQATKDFLQACRQQVAAAGVDNVRMTTLVSCVGGSADLGRHICEHAADSRAEILVLGNRGMGGAQRALLGLLGLGSVSDYVLKHALVPSVLVHKTKVAERMQG